MSSSLQVLDMIIADCATDVKDFDGKPFSGKTVGELHGVLEAKIEALAKVMKKHLLEHDVAKLEEAKNATQST